MGIHRVYALAAAVILVGSAAADSQQPTQIDTKTSGMLRVVVNPGALSEATLPSPGSERERSLLDVGTTTRRGAALPPLELFVQYAEAAPAITAPPPGRLSAEILALAANDSVTAIELNRPPSFQLDEVRPFNRDARLTHNVEEFITRYPGFTGAGRVAVVVDGGAVLVTHQEFQTATPPPQSRISVRTMQPQSRHATHVAGTIIASGVDPRAKGMAPAASIISTDFNADIQNIEQIPPTGVHVTNHSYGPRAGWDRDDQYGWLWWGDRVLSEVEDAQFGKYTAKTSAFDRVLNQPARERWAAFVAAGNDRDDAPLRQPVDHWAYTIVDGTMKWHMATRERGGDGFDRGGVDTLSTMCVAKNAICVGAINDAPRAQAFATTDFSAWGPTDDGRIKPDLTANGHNVLSASNASDDSYLELPGTSMASPVAAGIGIVVGQTFEANRKRPPLGVELKAILIHSAIDAGRPGPDVEFGWGVINALAAGDVAARVAAHIVEAPAVGGGSGDVSMKVTNDGKTPVRVTLVWSDPPGVANQRGLDDASPALQNDLDLQLVDPRGTVHLPYRLSLNGPLDDATRGVNSVDNVEVVDAPPLQGAWQVRVRARMLRVGPTQRAAVVTTGLRR